jgi:hypothetical protein
LVGFIVGKELGDGVSLYQFDGIDVGTDVGSLVGTRVGFNVLCVYHDNKRRCLLFFLFSFLFMTSSLFMFILLL